MARPINRKIKKIYDLLEGHFGDLRWWPAETAFEVIIGAVLTQNTSWVNVEKAISNLRDKGLLDPAKLSALDAMRLSQLIKPSGYHRVKARRLKEVVRFLMSECEGKIARLKRRKISPLRKKLLEVKGIGPETADSILVYALGKPVFVVDAYTRRIFLRHKLIEDNVSYNEIQLLVHSAMPFCVKALNQFHALLVETAKRYCKKNNPLCSECPLGSIL